MTGPGQLGCCSTEVKPVPARVLANNRRPTHEHPGPLSLSFCSLRLQHRTNGHIDRQLEPRRQRGCILFHRFIDRAWTAAMAVTLTLTFGDLVLNQMLRPTRPQKSASSGSEVWCCFHSMTLWGDMKARGYIEMLLCWKIRIVIKQPSIVLLFLLSVLLQFFSWLLHGVTSLLPLCWCSA